MPCCYCKMEGHTTTTCIARLQDNCVESLTLVDCFKNSLAIAESKLQKDNERLAECVKKKDIEQKKDDAIARGTNPPSCQSTRSAPDPQLVTMNVVVNCAKT